MKIVVFCGPTISAAEVRKTIKDPVCLPIAGQGDVISALFNHRPGVMVIIDGIFGEDGLSIWHKEILFALKSGVEVYGASSLGAVRAAELDSFGMKGFGEVYKYFKSDISSDDDEIAVKFEKRRGAYKKLSESMVNIRATFEKARKMKVIDADTCKALTCIAKSLFYSRRNFGTIFEEAQKAGLSKSRIEKIKKFASERFVDLQKKDALGLLETVAKLPEPPKEAESDVPVRGNFTPLYDRERKVGEGGTMIPLYYISDNAAIGCPEIDDLNFNAINSRIVLFFAKASGVEADEDGVSAELSRLRRKLGVKTDSGLDKWLSDNDMSHNELKSFAGERAIIRKMQAWMTTRLAFSRNTRPLLDEMRMKGIYTRFKSRAIKAEKTMHENPGAFEEILSSSDFHKLLSEHIASTGYKFYTDILSYSSEMCIDKASLMIELMKEKLAREKDRERLEKFLGIKSGWLKKSGR